ncbi:MAG TPA: hemolysin family protein [Acidimicrobiia bacterium]|nr:hemolysin family protein [Acidimicrobiia bacterium]
MTATIVGVVALIAAAAVRAGGFAILRIPRADALRDAAEGRSGAHTVARLLENRDDLPPAINAVHSALLLGSAVPLTWSIAEEVRGAGVIWALWALVIGLWLLGDFLPRAVGRFRPRMVAYRLAPLVRVVVRWGVAANEILADEEEMASNGEDEDQEDEEEERELISSVLEFTDTLVREVMVPRTDMVTIDRGAGVAELAALAAEHGYSRFPLTNGSDSEIAGMVLTKDVLGAFAAGKTVDTIDEFRREVAFVPETKHVSDLLREMQATKNHLGIVVDEFGDITGLVTIEDLLEELVGEISDEHDEIEELVINNGDGSLLVDARLDVSELEEILGVELPDEEWDTVAGLVLALAGRVPEEGEEFEVNGLNLKVLRVQGRRVAEVEVRGMTTSVGREATG